MRQSHKTILIWAILILMFVSIYSMFTDSSSKEKEVDVTSFRSDLANREKAKEIEKIRIEPGAHDTARYVITKRTNPTKEVVHAEYPGTITKEIYEAGINYDVKDKDESSIWPQVLVWWLPMLLLVGSRDTVFSVDRVAATQAALNAAGCTVQLRILPDFGHSYASPGADTVNAVAWEFLHDKRLASPPQFTAY